MHLTVVKSLTLMRIIWASCRCKNDILPSFIIIIIFIIIILLRSYSTKLSRSLAHSADTSYLPLPSCQAVPSVLIFSFYVFGLTRIFHNYYYYSTKYQMLLNDLRIKEKLYFVYITNSDPILYIVVKYNIKYIYL